MLASSESRSTVDNSISPIAPKQFNKQRIGGVTELSYRQFSML